MAMEIKHRLKEFIDEYDKILVLDCDKITDKGLIYRFLKHMNRPFTEKKYLVLLNDIEVLRNIEEYIIDVVLLSRKEFDELMQIYRMYEFTDRITLVSEKNNFPGILNYLHNGILSEQECFEALLK